MARGIRPLWLDWLFVEHVHAQYPEIQVYRNWSTTLKIANQYSALDALSHGMMLHHEVSHLVVMLRNEVHEQELAELDKERIVNSSILHPSMEAINIIEQDPYAATAAQHSLRWNTKFNEPELLNTLSRQTFKPYQTPQAELDREQRIVEYGRAVARQLDNSQQASSNSMRGSNYNSFMNLLNQPPNYDTHP